MKGVKKSSTAAAKSADIATSSVDLKSDVIFKAIDERMRENVEKAKSVNAIFLYNILKNGQVAKQWSKLIDTSNRGLWLNTLLKSNCMLLMFLNIFLAIDLKSVKLYQGPPKGVNADTTISVTDEDFVEIALGKINPQLAFMKGKLKISGNIMLTQKLMPLLKTGPKL